MLGMSEQPADLTGVAGPPRASTADTTGAALTARGGAAGGASPVERALLGVDDAEQALSWVTAAVRAMTGTGVAQLLFRAGRTDAAWGLRLDDGTDVVAKVHRSPAEQLAALQTTHDAMTHLHRAGFPCPRPLSPPALVDGRVVTVQTLLEDGETRDGTTPSARAAMCAAHAEHIELLASFTSRVAVGAGPPWTRWRDGTWPSTHDDAVDVTSDVTGALTGGLPGALPGDLAGAPGWQWLTDQARAACTELGELVRAGTAGPVVVGHADWYAGNLRFAGDRVVGVFDWELLADAEAVVVGLFAGGYLRDDAPTPEQVVAYLDGYDRHRPLRGAVRRAALAAARWMLGFNARCDLAGLPVEVLTTGSRTGPHDHPGGLPPEVPPGSALGRLAVESDGYASMS